MERDEGEGTGWRGMEEKVQDGEGMRWRKRLERDEGEGKGWRGIEWEVKDGDGMKRR